MGRQWHQLDHIQIICTSLQTDNHASTSPLRFYRPDVLPAAQPTVSTQSAEDSNHWGTTTPNLYLEVWASPCYGDAKQRVSAALLTICEWMSACCAHHQRWVFVKQADWKAVEEIRNACVSAMLDGARRECPSESRRPAVRDVWPRQRGRDCSRDARLPRDGRLLDTRGDGKSRRRHVWRAVDLSHLEITMLSRRPVDLKI